MLVANYQFKKDLKAAVGEELRFTETSMYGSEFRRDGEFTVVGPGAYDRKWYATIVLEDGVIVKVS